jgi:hypothetical protein
VRIVRPSGSGLYFRDVGRRSFVKDRAFSQISILCVVSGGVKLSTELEIPDERRGVRQVEILHWPIIFQAFQIS